MVVNIKWLKEKFFGIGPDPLTTEEMEAFVEEALPPLQKILKNLCIHLSSSLRSILITFILQVTGLAWATLYILYLTVLTGSVINSHMIAVITRLDGYTALTYHTL